MTSTSTSGTTTTTTTTSSSGGSGSSTMGLTISTSQFDRLLAVVSSSSEGLQKQMDDKLQQFKEQIIKEAEITNERASKKAKLEKQHVFKSKGNEEQHRFLESTLVELESAEVELRQVVEDSASSSTGSAATVSAHKPGIEKALDFVKQCKSKMKQRQKLILMADRSDHGWSVVNEYQTDELASDEEDEKRITKAVKRAEQKAESRESKKKKNQKQKAAGGARLQFPRHSFGGYSGTAANIGYGSGYGSRQVVPVRQPMVVGPCFACKEYGHLRANCPRARSSMYPFIHVGEDEFVTRVVELSGALSVSADTCTDEKAVVSVEGEISVGDNEECLVGVSEMISVKGRLREHYKFWRDTICASKTILSIVEHGYFLPLMYEPDQFSRANNRTAFEHEGFVTDSIAELVAQSSVRVWEEGRPHVCSPLMVVVNKSSGKKRLVISLKYLNLFLWKDKFKYEDIRVAMNYFERSGYMCTFDLKSGYHHIDICEASQKYLGFEWKGTYYVFTVLPFGLASACYVFTKLLRPIVKYFRARGHRLVIYVDDGILTAADYPQTKHLCEMVVDTLSKAGFVLNVAKSSLEPSRKVTWLGFDIDLECGNISVPQQKLDLFRQELACILSCRERTHLVKRIASIVGKLISFSIAVGPIARLRTRELYRVIQSRDSWASRVSLSEEALQELQFWYGNLEKFNGKGMWRSPSAVRVVYSDASDTGYAGYIVEHGEHIAHGMWSAVDQAKSSTWRELRAVALVLLSFAQKLANTNVRWFTDNQNVVAIVAVGSKLKYLHDIAVEIFMLCFEHNVRLEVEWVPRQDNELADYYSRIVDVDDWGLSQWVFDRYVEPEWGPITIDRFASIHNAKTRRFNSRYWNPFSEAVDAFTVNWEGENNYWCPPIGLVCRVIYHAEACGATGVHDCARMAISSLLATVT